MPRSETQGSGTITTLCVYISTSIAVVAQQRFHRGYMWMRICRPNRRLHECRRATIASLPTTRIYISPFVEEELYQPGTTLARGP